MQERDWYDTHTSDVLRAEVPYDEGRHAAQRSITERSGTLAGYSAAPSDELVELAAKALAAHDGADYWATGNVNGQDDYRESARVVLAAVWPHPWDDAAVEGDGQGRHDRRA